MTAVPLPVAPSRSGATRAVFAAPLGRTEHTPSKTLRTGNYAVAVTGVTNEAGRPQAGMVFDQETGKYTKPDGGAAQVTDQGNLFQSHDIGAELECPE